MSSGKFSICIVLNFQHLLFHWNLKNTVPRKYFSTGKSFKSVYLFSLSIPLAASRAIIMFTLCAIIGNLIFSREAARKHFRKLGKILISCWSYIRIRVDQHHTNIMSFFLSLYCTAPIIQIMFIVIPDIFIVTNILTAVHCYFRVSSSPLDWVTTAFMWLLELDFKQDLTRAKNGREFYFL